MLRTLVIALVLGNVLLLAANLGSFDGLSPASREREPERLARQYNPGAVRLTPGGPAASAAGPANIGSARASGTVAAAPIAAASAPQASASAVPEPARCLQVGPLANGQVASLQAALRAGGWTDDRWQVLNLALSPGFAVVMGPYTDRGLMQRKENELRRRQVAFTVLTASPELPPGTLPGLSLGRFDDEASADAALSRLGAAGVRSARVVALLAGTARPHLRLPTVTASQETALLNLPLPATARWTVCDTAAASAPGGGR
jgi:hypothetical protein